MAGEKTILYVQTTDAPEKQYSPLVLAHTAKMMDITPIVFYLGTSRFPELRVTMITALHFTIRSSAR